MDCTEFKRISNSINSEIPASVLIEHRIHSLEYNKCGECRGEITSISCTEYDHYTKDPLAIRKSSMPFGAIKNMCDKHLIECSFHRRGDKRG